MGEYLNFKEEGLKSVHFFMEKLEYPVVIAVYTKQEEMLVKCMEEIFPTSGFTTEGITKWCEEQGLEYRVMMQSEGVSN